MKYFFISVRKILTLKTNFLTIFDLVMSLSWITLQEKTQAFSIQLGLLTPNKSVLLFVFQDAFASERRKAKMLNFSIAYGKTPVGLARDWKVPMEVRKFSCRFFFPFLSFFF